MGLNKFLLKRVLIASLFFGICMAVSPPYFSGIIPSAIKGIVAVIFFAIPTFLFWRLIFFFIEQPLFVAKNLPTLIKPQNESIIYSSYAVYYLEEKGIRGKLYLLDNTLQFQPYNLKRLTEVLVINLAEIENLDSFKLTKYTPEGLVITYNGEIAKFILFETPTWKKLITEKLLN